MTYHIFLGHIKLAVPDFEKYVRLSNLMQKNQKNVMVGSMRTGYVKTLPSQGRVQELVLFTVTEVPSFLPLEFTHDPNT